MSIVWYQDKERSIEESGKLYPHDVSLSVTAGQANLAKWTYNIFLDKGTQVSYKSLSWSEKTITLTRWRLWSEGTEGYNLKLKNLDAKLHAGDVILAEQQSQVYSIIYVLRGSVNIVSGWRNMVLGAGQRLMISQSDLANPSTTLDGLSGKIDDAIRQNAFFIAHGGEAYLSSLSDKTTEKNLTGTVFSGNISPSGKYIEMTTPADGSVISTETIDINGKISSPDIKKVTINGKEAKISPVDEIFFLKWFPITSDTTDLVYKAYDAGSNLIERWVITVFSKNKMSTDKLVPTTFSTGDTKFRFTNPLENPYRTNDKAVTVSGVVPKDTVEYITVNGFRLKKFVPKSTTWYYYANIGYDTMKEWFNLYEIRFYGPDDTLITAQAFTIIKEGSTVSGE